MPLDHLSDDLFQRPILLAPHFSPRPWGGDKLRTLLEKNTPQGNEPIGESWELSDHPDGQSLVAEGSPAAGIPFGELVRTRPLEMIGRDEGPALYPLLVKYIDAAGDLSVQVHPNDTWCQRHNHPDRGKSESWYVMDCPPGTNIIHGYKPGVTEEQARTAVKHGNFTSILNFRPIQPGDFIAVPPGTVHALLAGTTICEIQQSSNTTFRLYDWDRLPARKLHIDEAMQVSEFDPANLPPIQNLGPVGEEEKLIHLIETDFFLVTMFELGANQTAKRAPLTGMTGTILNIVAGQGTLQTAGGLKTELTTGQTYFLPAAMPPASLTAKQNGIRTLITESREI